MGALRSILFSLLIAWAAFSTKAFAEHVICDPLQSVDMNLEIEIDQMTLCDLRDLEVTEMTLRPAVDCGWKRSFPLENGTTLKFCDKADPLSLELQQGVLVTYNTCEGEMVYAFCQIQEDMKGKYPQEMKLHLDPILGQCRIEVLCTQCP